MNIDAVARSLADFGAQARAMPRGAFERGGQTHPLICGGHLIGHMVPGHGLALDADLKVMGITKKIPNVAERTPWMRLLEKLSDDRGAITTMAGLRSSYTSGFMDRVTVLQTTQIVGPSSHGMQPNNWYMTYQLQDSARDGGSLDNFSTSTPVAPDRTNPASAWNKQMRDPSGSRTKYLVGVSALSFTATSAPYTAGILIDVLSSRGQIAVNTTPQTATTSALTRYTDGAGVYIATASTNSSAWAWVTSPATVTISYTNQAGTAAQSSATPSTNLMGFAQLISDDGAAGCYPAQTLASGDYGVRAVATVACSETVASPASIGLMLYHPLAFLVGPELNVTTEIEAVNDVMNLVQLPTTAGGLLGHFSFLWRGGLSLASDNITSFVLDSVEG